MSLDELKDKIRQKFIKKDKKIRIVSSESFAPNSAPNLIGFKALFEGKRGIKFIWAVADKHGWMDVTVIQVEGKNLADFNSEIGEKIFGPDRYPSEPATNKGSAQ